MKSGKCPKCGSTRINEPLNIPQGIYVKVFRLAGCVYYVCRDCGYVERYLNEHGFKLLEKHGRLMSTEPRMCSTCGAEVQPGAKRCPSCESVISDSS